DGAEGSGWGWSEAGLGDTLGDHSACRGDEDEPAHAPARGGVTGSGVPDGGGGGMGGSPEGGDASEREVVIPTLAIHRGGLPEPRRQGGAIAWFPRGNPNYFALDDVLSQYY